MNLPTYPPMLAVSWESAFDDERWGFEPKLDGVRAIVSIDHGTVKIRSRNGNDMTSSYPELMSLTGVGDGTILDAEIIAYDDQGLPSFERLQSRMHRTGPSSIPITLVAFDVLVRRRVVLIDQPLSERLAVLSDIDLPSPSIQSTVIPGSGVALFSAVAAKGLEGIMAKRLDSMYRPGERSSGWRKIPHVRRTRAVVAGYTESERIRAGGFGALLLGMWEDDHLRYVGSVGTGFDHESARAIRSALEQMTVADSPFIDDSAVPAATFVYPHLVAEIAFKQWTRAGRLRAPSFKGFSDRAHAAITWETEGPTSNDR